MREDFTVVLGATTYTVHYVPPDLSTYTVTTSPAAVAEDVLLTPNGTYLLVVDRAGQPLYYRTFQPDHVENFEQNVLPSGATVYSTQVGPFTAGAWTPGDHRSHWNAQFGDIDDIYAAPRTARTAPCRPRGTTSS